MMKLSREDRQGMLADLLANPSYENLLIASQLDNELRQERQAEELGASTMRGSFGVEMPAPQQQMPVNYVQNSAGKVTSLDHAALPRADVWADGPRVLRKELMEDGRTRQWVKVPAMVDGRQSSGVQEQIVTPDYLNPAMTKKLQYQKLQNEVNGKTGEKDHWTKIESNGKLYRLNTRNGAIEPLTAEGQQLEGPGMEKIRKNKLLAESTQAYANKEADVLEEQLAAVFGTDRAGLAKMLAQQNEGQAKNVVAPAIGLWDQRMPTLFQGTRNIESAVEALKTSAQRYGLTNLRKAGVAPGSITEKEWAKFETALANIDPTLSEGEFIKQMRNLYNNIQSGRDAGRLDYEELTNAAPQPVGADAQGQLIMDAEAAIAAGADRNAVMERLRQQLGGR